MEQQAEIKTSDVQNLLVGGSSLAGQIEVPPSKSLYHRGIICAALAGKPNSCEDRSNPSQDIVATRHALEALLSGGVDTAQVDCGESGTTVRLLIPVAAALGRESVFIGHGRLPKRPLRTYADCFASSGVKLEFPADSQLQLPLKISGRLTPGQYSLPGNISSQFVSGLLLALPLLGENSSVRITSELESRPYVDMTLSVMKHFGVHVCEETWGYSIAGGQRYTPPKEVFRVEPDASQEAFWILANYLGSKVELGQMASTLQGDTAFRSFAEQLRNAAPDEVVAISAAQTPDLVPALAAMAAWSPCAVRITNAERLRIKESDRLATTTAMLRAFGSAVEETADGLAIPAGLPTPPETMPHIDGAGDHRIIMTAAMLATRTPCIIHGAEAVAKSYPTFFHDYATVGGKVSCAE